MDLSSHPGCIDVPNHEVKLFGASRNHATATTIFVPMTVPKLRSSIRSRSPSLSLERSLWGQGNGHVVGIDEVGKGAWAGPLTIGMAVVPSGRRVYKVRDSKMLKESEREALFDRIAQWCEAWAIGHASPAECDELGMSEAQRLAARRAFSQLDFKPDAAIMDGNWDFVDPRDIGEGGTSTIVNGDVTSLSIAAASVLAKVTRDRIMRSEATHYPYYNFEGNKGYPGPAHVAGIAGWGPSAIHRRSWVFMDHQPWSGARRFVRPEAQ